MGVNVNTVISMTFVIGAGLGAIAGVMVAANYDQAHSHMGFLIGLKAFTAAVLGGIGNLAGAMLGGVLLGLIEALRSLAQSGMVGENEGRIELDLPETLPELPAEDGDHGPLWQLSGPPEAVMADLEHAFKFNDAVLRSLTVLKKHADTAPSVMMKSVEREEARKSQQASEAEAS